MKFSELLKGDKKLKYIMLFGIASIVIIAIMSFIPQKKSQPLEVMTEKTIEEYKASLEKEVMKLVTSIDGVGKANIMVTLKNGVEYVYAKEEKQNTDKTNGATGDEQTIQQRDNYEQKTILVEDDNGRKTALVKTKLEPTVKGVVIVCDGGDDVLVQEKVTEAVKTALGIGANNVCVTKLG